MATAKSPELCFSSSRGENIHLSEDRREATWFLRQSGNYIYASQNIQPNKTYTIDVVGSGHVDVGIVTVNPETISCEKRDPSFRRTNEVKVHKRTFSVSFRIVNNQVISRYNEEEYKIKMNADTSAWIAIYPRFGEISATIKCDEPLRFSRNCGHNIRLDDHDTKAITINKSPAAICFPTNKLRPNENAVFQCSPVIDGERKPRRFHLKIMIHRFDPEDMRKNFKGTFDTSVKSTSDPPWTCIGLLDHLVCEGRVTLTLDDANSVTCLTQRGYKKTMAIPFDASDGIWLIFELYRVSLSVLYYGSARQTQPKKEESVVSGGGRDEPDSVIKKDSANENVYVDEPNNPKMPAGEPSYRRCRPECLNIDTRDELGNSGESQALQRIENKIEELHKIFNTAGKTDPRGDSCLSPVPTSPPANPVRLDFQTNFANLITEMNAHDLIDHFFQHSIIGKNTLDEVDAEKLPDKANRILLRSLLGKTVDRNVFEKILRKTENSHLIPLFFPR